MAVYGNTVLRQQYQNINESFINSKIKNELINDP